MAAMETELEREAEGSSAGLHGDMIAHISSTGQVVGTVAVPEDESAVMKGDEGAKASDYANYFHAYSMLWHQKQMLTDTHRMDSYHSAIMKNPSLFDGKTVVDVGTGSGILACWSAQAGAKQVWAVEFTDMAQHAKQLMKHNKVDDRVNVVKAAIEELALPEHSVDIIISEWMGYFLLRESMLDSLIRARDRLLRPGGVMMPSHATMYWGIVYCEDERERRAEELEETMNDWKNFTSDTLATYGVDMGCLDKSYAAEQKEYFTLSSTWYELAADQVIGSPVAVKHLDMHTCTIKDALGVDETPFEFTVQNAQRVSAFAGWFDTDFAGSTENPCTERVLLSTDPGIGYTHWGQQVFFLEEPIDLSPGDTLKGTMKMFRQKSSARLYNVTVDFQTVKNGVESGIVSATYEIPQVH